MTWSPTLAFALVASLFLAACDGGAEDDEVGAARTKILDPGAGAERDEALWTLVTGSRRVQQDGVVAIPDRVQRFGKTLYRFQGVSTVRCCDQTDEGAFSAGAINLGRPHRRPHVDG